MLRGSRLYGSPVSGSCTKNVRFSVLRVRNGSITAVRRVRQQQHVRLVDLLEAADRRAVEHQAVAEDLLVEGLRGHREVLHGPGQVAEPDVDELHPLGLDEPQDLIAAGEHPLSLAPLAPLAGWRPASGRCWNARRSRFPTRIPDVSPMLRAAPAPGSSGGGQAAPRRAQAVPCVCGGATVDRIVAVRRGVGRVRERVSRSAARAARDRGRVGGRGRPAARRAADRLADVRGHRLGRVPQPVPDHRGVRRGGLPADRADRLHGGQAAAGPAGGAARRQAGRLRLVRWSGRCCSWP